MAIKGVIFDVGGVLVESPFVAAMRWRDELDLPREVMEVMFAQYASVAAPGEEPPPWHRVETGELELDAFVQHTKGQFARYVPPEHPVMTLRGRDFNVFANAGAHWAVVHRVRELNTSGYVTAILTNNVREWAAWRDVLPIDDFDVVVDSCEVGLRKPDPRIWHLTLDRMGLTAEETVFLDDHPRNVDAAAQLGLKSLIVGSDIDVAMAELDELLAAS